MLLVQKYLETHTFGDLIRDHGVYASFSKSGHKFSLNYDQIEAKESDPLAQECRGLILAPADGKPLYCEVTADGKRHYENVGPGETVILAYPMKRFFNHGQGCAAEINWSDPNLAVLEKLDGCFSYRAQLNCWDGSSIDFGKVVKNHLTPILIGMDENGNLVPCQVLDWFNNGTKDNWLEIETNLKCRGKNRKFLVTSNHSIFINGSFQPALTGKIGDKLSSIEEEISDSIRHVIESSLLGDATLSKNGKNYIFQEGHKTEHKELCESVINWLGECYSNTGKYLSGFGTEMMRVSSKPNKIITDLRKKWYVGSTKIIPQSLDWMDDFTVAKWYMDDGSLSHNDDQKDRANFATNGFTEKEVLRLGDRLTELYGVDCAVYNSKGWCLRVNAGRNGEIDNLWKAIAPHIVNCMKYKLPQVYRDTEYITYPKGFLVKKLTQCNILDIKKIKIDSNNEINFPSGRVGYDIKTSTGNYICNGVLVHNSLCIVYHDFFAHKWCVATRSVSEADLLMDNGLFTFRTLFEKAVQDTCGISFKELTNYLDLHHTYCFELTTPYNRIVVNYKGCGVTLLAARDLTTNLEVYPDRCGLVEKGILPCVQAHTYTTVPELLEWVSSLNPMDHEGVVIRDSQFNRLKVKNAAYVAYNKVRDTLATSERNCVELILAEKDDDCVPFLPEEIVKNLQKIKEGLQKALHEHDLIFDITKSFVDVAHPGSKKEFALAVQKAVEHGKTINRVIWSAPLFQMFDGKAGNMREFIQNNRKNGTWGDSFLDKLLEMSKKFGA